MSDNIEKKSEPLLSKKRKELLSNPMDSDNPIPTTKDISIVFISEMVGRIITKTHSILNTLYDGSVSEDIIAKVSKFEKRMRLPVNAVQLKRNIAEYVFDQKKYPY